MASGVACRYETAFEPREKIVYPGIPLSLECFSNSHRPRPAGDRFGQNQVLPAWVRVPATEYAWNHLLSAFRSYNMNL